MISAYPLHHQSSFRSMQEMAEYYKATLSELTRLRHLFKRLIFSWKLNGRFRDRAAWSKQFQPWQQFRGATSCLVLFVQAGGVGALEQLGIWPHLHEDDIQPQRCDIL